jgi:hypothetical protein
MCAVRDGIGSLGGSSGNPSTFVEMPLFARNWCGHRSGGFGLRCYVSYVAFISLLSSVERQSQRPRWGMVFVLLWVGCRGSDVGAMAPEAVVKL